MLCTDCIVKTIYQFRISTYNADGVLNSADAVVSNQITAPPGQPQNLTTSDIQETQITWTWDTVTGADLYYVYDGSNNYLGESASNEYTQTDLTANTQYTIQVRAHSTANGTGIISSSANAYTDASAPQNASHSDNTVDSITWTWDNDGQTSFYAQDKNNTGDTSGWIETNSWTQSSLSANTQYTLQVKAKNESDVETTFSEATAYTAQNVPTSLTFSSPATDSLTITAEGTFPNLGTGSSVVHFDNGAGTTQDNTASAAWTNTGLSPNVQYTYTVYATNGNGDQTSSINDSTYTLATTPGQITATSTASTSTLELTLDANGNPDSTNVLIYSTTTGQYLDIETGTLVGDTTDFQSISSWGTVTVSGLTANTAYQFVAIAKNGDDVLTVTSTASIAVYTLPEAPTSVSAVAGSEQIALSWSGSASAFQAENTTLSTSTSWSAATTYTFTDLTCGTSYDFRVKARNADGAEGAWSETVSATTNDCPAEESVSNANTNGGGTLLIDPITFTGVLINNLLNATTNNNTVSISITGVDTVPGYIAISLDNSFDSAIWNVYDTNSYALKLPEEAGVYTLYVKIKSEQGAVSEVRSAQVTYTPSLEEVADDTNIETLSTPVFTQPKANANITKLPFSIVGSANPGSEVEISIGSSKYTVTADESGTFTVVVLDQLPPGKYTLSARQRTHENTSLEATRVVYYQVENNKKEAVDELSEAESTDIILDTVPSTEYIVESGNTSDVQKTILFEAVPEVPYTEKQVDEFVEKVQEEKQPYMFVLQAKGSAFFVKYQTQDIESLTGDDIELLVRPEKDVHSIVSRLYKKNDDHIQAEISNDEVSLLQRIKRLFGTVVYASHKKDHLIKGYVFEKLDTVEAYKGNITFENVPPGTYELLTTFNNEDGTRVHVSKNVHIQQKGVVKKSSGEPVDHGVVKLFYKTSALSKSFKPWNAEEYNQANPYILSKDGSYRFSVPAGIYYLVIDIPGYHTYTSEEMVLDRATTISNDIIMERKELNWWSSFWEWLRTKIL